MSVRKRTWKTKAGPREAWVVDYKDGQGKRRLKTFDRKRDADAWQAQARVEVRQGTHTPDSASITVADACENWIKAAELGRGDGEKLEPTTIASYRQHADLHIKPRIGREKLSRLTTPGAEAFKDSLLEDLSRPMAKKVLSSLKSVLSEAMRRGHVSQNVAAGVRIKNSDRHEEEIEAGKDFPSREEVHAILNKATGKWRAFLLTAALTGLRASELRGLAWEHVDFGAKKIRVNQRADYAGTIGSPKSKSSRREVPMVPTVANALKAWKKECPKGELGLVFPNGQGNVENHSNILSRGFAPIQIAAGVTLDSGKKDKDGNPVMAPKYGLHALRHFFASWCINAKAAGGLELPPKTVQTWLGHRTINLTLDTYGHLFPTDDKTFGAMAKAAGVLVGARDKNATKSA